jgi:hypothetical protein
MPPGLPKHPYGTVAFMVGYAVLFMLGWYAVYIFIYLARQPVTA